MIHIIISMKRKTKFYFTASLLSGVEDVFEGIFVELVVDLLELLQRVGGGVPLPAPALLLVTVPPWVLHLQIRLPEHGHLEPLLVHALLQGDQLGACQHKNSIVISPTIKQGKPIGDKIYRRKRVSDALINILSLNSELWLPGAQASLLTRAGGVRMNCRWVMAVL